MLTLADRLAVEWRGAIGLSIVKAEWILLKTIVFKQTQNGIPIDT